MICNHEAMPAYFSIKNQDLKCAKCGVKIRMSDEHYHDWIFAKNAYREKENQIEYKYIVIDDGSSPDETTK